MGILPMIHGLEARAWTFAELRQHTGPGGANERSPGCNGCNPGSQAQPYSRPSGADERTSIEWEMFRFVGPSGAGPWGIRYPGAAPLATTVGPSGAFLPFGEATGWKRWKPVPLRRRNELLVRNAG